MILEHALLHVRPGHADEFLAAFAEAKALMARMHGFHWMELHRGIEADHRFLLLVGWDTVEDHAVGFRLSPEYQEWKELLHRYYSPFPVVEYYEQVVRLEPAGGTEGK